MCHAQCYKDMAKEAQLKLVLDAAEIQQRTQPSSWMRGITSMGHVNLFEFTGPRVSN